MAQTVVAGQIDEDIGMPSETLPAKHPARPQVCLEAARLAKKPVAHTAK
jgi:hypothetical protein